MIRYRILMSAILIVMKIEVYNDQVSESMMSTILIVMKLEVYNDQV